MARQGKANVDNQEGLQAVQVRCCQIPERGNIKQGMEGIGTERICWECQGVERNRKARQGYFFLLYNRSFLI